MCFFSADSTVALDRVCYGRSQLLHTSHPFHIPFFTCTLPMGETKIGALHSNSTSPCKHCVWHSLVRLAETSSPDTGTVASKVSTVGVQPPARDGDKCPDCPWVPQTTQVPSTRPLCIILYWILVRTGKNGNQTKLWICFLRSEGWVSIQMNSLRLNSQENLCFRAASHSVLY